MDVTTEYIPIYDSYPEPVAKKLWVQDYDKMKVHTQGLCSVELIETRRPNESTEIKDYRIANYRPVTQTVFNQASDNAKRILSHSNVEIVFPEKIKELCFQPVFDGMDFLNYFRNIYFDKMIDAANAFMVVWPTGDVGNVEVQAKVELIIVMPEDVIHADEHVFTFLSEEKSMIERNGEILPIGEVYYVVTANELWKRVEVWEGNKQYWDWQPYAANPIGFVYPFKLGGKEVCTEVYGKNNYGTDDWVEVHYLKSYFGHALAYADECAARFSDNQGVAVSCSSPLKEVEPIDCTTCSGTGKIAIYSDNQRERIDRYDSCGTCNGRKKVSPLGGPYTVLIRPQRQKGPNDYDTSDIPVVRFIHPDVSILDYSDKTWQDFLKMTKDALALLRIDQAQSGVAKDIDRENQLSVLDILASHLYKDSITNVLRYMHKFLYPNEDMPVVIINLPSSFIIKHEAEIIDDISRLRNQSAPDFILIEANRELVQTRYGSDQFRMKIFDTLVAVDPLFIKSDSQVNMLNSSTMITNEQAVWHMWATPVVEKYAREMGMGFVEMFLNDVVAAVEPLIQAKVDSVLAGVSSLDNGGQTRF